MFHRIFADNTNKKSIANKLRKKRFQIFLEMLKDYPAPVRVLDVGGTQEYWENIASGFDILRNLHVTLLNLEKEETTKPNFSSIAGDARSLKQFSDKQFDIVFSNSVIEHVGEYSDQKRMADEIIRVGKEYYIQTPNKYFPVEPHFFFPFFQFFPITLRARLLQNFKLGWFPKTPDFNNALSEVKSIRLINKTEYQELFPDAKIIKEKLFGLTKSFIALSQNKKNV